MRLLILGAMEYTLSVPFLFFGPMDGSAFPATVWSSWVEVQAARLVDAALFGVSMFRVLSDWSRACHNRPNGPRGK